MTGPQGKRGKSVQSRLILLLLFILIPVLAIQAFIYYESYEARRASEIQANLEIARAVAKTFESFIQDVLHQELAIGLAITSSQPMTSNDITRLLGSSQSNVAIRDFTWMNPNGDAIYSSNPEMVGYNYSERSYYREIVNGREWSVSELIIAKTTGKPTFAISRGIRDSKGTLLGVIFAAVLPDKLDALLAIERGRGGGHALVDNKGMLVYRHPAINPTWEERNWLKDYPGLAETLKGEETSKTVYAPYEGKKRMAVSTPVSSIGWAVTAARTEDEVTGPILSSIAQSALLFLSVSLAAFFIALAVSRKITNPIKTLRAHALAFGHGGVPEQVEITQVSDAARIRRLGEGASTIGNGNLDHRIDIEGNDEIAELSEAFNAMTGRLNDSYNELRSEIIERKRLEEETHRLLASVQTEKDRLSALISSMNDEVWFADLDKTFVLANPAALREFGYGANSRVDAEKMAASLEIYRPDGTPRSVEEAPALRALKGEVVRNQEEIIRTPANDELRHREVNAAPVRDMWGNIIGSIAVVRDITDRKRAEEKLKASEKKLSEIYASMSEGLALHEIISDHSGKAVDYLITDVNPAFEKITGLNRDQIIDKKASAAYGTGEAPYLDTYAKVASTGEPVTFEVHFAPMNKYFNISVFSPDKGKFATIFQDITDRRRAEEALRLTQTSIDSAAEMVAWFTPDGRIHYVNDATCRALGYSREELLQMTALDFSPGFTWEQYQAHWQEVRERKSFTLEPTHRRKDGSEYPAEVLVNYVVYGGQEFIFAYGRDITERKRAEQELQTTLQRFYTVLASMHSSILLVTDEGRVEFANQAFCDYFELQDSPSDLRDLTAYEMIEKIKNAYLNPDEAVTRIGEIVGRGQPVIGEEIAMRGERACLRDYIPLSVDRKSYGRLWHHWDITELKRAEDALREAKNELEERVKERTYELYAESLYARSLIEASLDPLVTISVDGKITDVNRASEEVTGVSKEQLIGSDFSNFFTEPEKARTGYEEVFRQGFVRDYPLELKRQDGHVTPVLYNASVYRDDTGQIMGVFAAARDITERRRAEEIVKAERQRLYDVLETLPVYAILLTPDYQVSFANRFFRERFGEDRGRRCYEYLFNRTEPCEICETYTVRKTGKPHHWEWTGPDGRNYDIFDFPFRDSDGSPLIMEVGVDITKRKQAETSLRRLASELAMAEERERKRIAGVLHDDIAQTLATVRMRLDMLQGITSDRNDQQTLKEAKTLLVQSLQETRALMNDLGNPVLFDLGLKAACEALANQMMERHPVRISCDIRDAFMELNPDMKTILFQSVKELLNNVVKHSRAHNAQLMIEMENKHLRVKVTDDGVGFDPQALGAPTVEGGFGLYNIRERLIAVGGSLSIESTPGTGTVVTVKLPAELD